MPAEYPDWRTGETLVVKRLLKNQTFAQARREVLQKYGKIYENVVTQSDAEGLGIAFFRVPKLKVTNGS